MVRVADLRPTQTAGEEDPRIFEPKEGRATRRCTGSSGSSASSLRSSWRGRRPRGSTTSTWPGRTELASRKRSWQSFAAGVNGVLGASRLALLDG